MARDLERFLTAQAADATYATALAELRAGRKRSHWMWFVLPQLRELGRSATAQHYGIEGIEEARRYLADPVLGPRLVECAQALLDLSGDDPVAVLGEVDAQKLQSSMTLFAHAAEEDDAARQVLLAVLVRYFGGTQDDQTVRLLAAERSAEESERT